MLLPVGHSPQRCGQGTKMQIKIPARLAYGSQGVSSMGIPQNADLIFKVEVLKVS
ncbi:MAG: hypothetical protein Ct9H300mP28_28410 [Pseudomonadota bacterium]|nr:MAG: hypothetical protein Ct9H300mP28_28410 [Pseudomonadota bacterium]